jgi:hypothetical protein
VLYAATHRTVEIYRLRTRAYLRKKIRKSTCAHTQLTTEEAASGGSKPILILMKKIYGMRQTGRLWNTLLDEKLCELNFKQFCVDMSILQDPKTTLILVGVYVYDLLGTSDNVLYSWLDQDRKRSGLRLQQNQISMNLYLVEQFGLKNAKPVRSPLAEVVLSADDLNQTEEASGLHTLACALLWITRCSCPDIGFIVHQMTRRAMRFQLI